MIPELKKTIEQKMQKSIEVLKADLAKSAPVVPTPGFSTMSGRYYGSMVPVNQVANVTLIDARTIGVQAWEKPMMQRSKRRFAIRTLASTPPTRAISSRVPMPALTEERRRDLIKGREDRGEKRQGCDPQICVAMPTARSRMRRRTRRSPGTRASARTTCEADRPLHPAKWTSCSPRKSRNSFRSEPTRLQTNSGGRMASLPFSSSTTEIPQLEDSRHVAIIMDGNGRWP